MRARATLVFLASFLIADQSDYNIRINSAIDDLYNFNLESCMRKVDALSKDYSEDALLPFLGISARWQHILLNDNPEASYKAIYQGIKQTVPYYHQMIDKYPQDPSYLLFLGSLYGLKARIDLAQAKWMDLVISGTKGFIYIDRAREMDSEFYDVYMPIGTLEYFLCRSSVPLQLIGSLFGLQSDCREAINKLETAATKSDVSWIESRNVLSYVYLYMERDYQRALQVSSSIADQFPGHPFFAYLKAESLVRLRMYDQFISYGPALERFYKTGPQNQRTECEDKHLYLKALMAFQEEEYGRVINLSNQVIDGYEVEFKWTLGYAHFIRGKSLELTGHRDSALFDYKKTMEHLEHYPEYQEAKNLLRAPISEEADSK
jgi:tetratricopeptide (TPR) repeat protein